MPNTVLFVGDALGVLDVKSIPVAMYDAASTYKITMGGKTVSVLGSGGTTTTVATALAAALLASAIAEFLELAWTSNAANVIGTANEDEPVGKTHTITPTVSGGTGTFGAVSTTTSPKGKEGLTAENCKLTTGTRALPANGDTFFVGQLDGNLRFGLDALAAITTLTVHFQASFLGECGLAFTNVDGDAPYNEYRQRYFQTDGGTIIIGGGEGSGSGRIMHDAQTSEAHWHVLLTDESDDDNQHACVIKGTHADNTLIAEGGTVDVAPHPGETTTLATLTASNAAVVRTSRGTTLGDVIVDNQAQVTIDSATGLTDITSITVHAQATVIVLGENTITSLVLDGVQPTAQLRPAAAMAITACTLEKGAILDLDNSPNLVTIATLTVGGECTINDRNGKLKVTNPVPGFYSLVTYNGPPGRSFTLEDP